MRSDFSLKYIMSVITNIYIFGLVLRSPSRKNRVLSWLQYPAAQNCGTIHCVNHLPGVQKHLLCVCIVTHIARVWINRVGLPILLVVSLTGGTNISLFALAPENLVSRDGLGNPVPRQPAHLHTQAESGAYLRDSSRVPRRRPFIYLKLPYAIG